MLAKKLETDSAIPHLEASSFAVAVKTVCIHPGGPFQLQSPPLLFPWARVGIPVPLPEFRRVPRDWARLCKAELLASIRVGPCNFTCGRCCFHEHW